MSIKVSYKIEGPVLQKLKQAGPKVKEEIGNALRDASTLYMEHAIREAPKSTSTLSQSIKRDLQPLSASVFPTVDYAPMVHGDVDEQGNLTKQRSDPRWIPAMEAQPGGTLYRWAKKKGMNPWAVRASIAEKGTRFNPFMSRAADDKDSEVKDIFNKMIQKIVNNLAD